MHLERVPGSDPKDAYRTTLFPDYRFANGIS